MKSWLRNVDSPPVIDKFDLENNIIPTHESVFFLITVTTDH